MSLWTKNRWHLAMAVFMGATAGAPAGYAEQGTRPELMPVAWAPSSTNEDWGSSAVEEPVFRQRSPVRLGLQGGVLGMAPDSSRPFHVDDTFVGGRFFSRLWLGGRWYLLPAVGYYHRVRGTGLGSAHWLDLSAGLQYALFRLGPVGLLLGVTQRVGWQFSVDNVGVRGPWFYRVGPGATLNIRLGAGLSLLTGVDLVFPVQAPGSIGWQPEWTLQTGFLFAL